MGNLGELAKYLPFLLSEMAKHPKVVTWFQQTLATMPAAEVNQVISDVQTLANQQQRV